MNDLPDLVTKTLWTRLAGQKMRCTCFIHHIDLSFLAFAVIIFSTSYTGAAEIDGLDRQQKALNVIADFADKFCKDIPLKETHSGHELTADGKAQLNGALSKVTDLGFKGAGTYKSGKSEGLLQKDLVKALEDNQNCRLTIWRDLQKKLLGSTSPPKPLPGMQSLEPIRAILNGCYRRAVFTRTHAQMDHEAMFASITECRKLVQQNVTKVNSPPLNQHVANLITALEGIEREKNRQPWDFSKIDSYKKEALKLFSKISNLTHITYIIPENLTEDSFFSKEEANLPPNVHNPAPSQIPSDLKPQGLHEERTNAVPSQDRQSGPIPFHEGIPEPGIIRFGPLTRIIPWADLQQHHHSLIGLGPQRHIHKGATQSSPLDIYVEEDNMYVDAVVTDSAGKVTLQIKKSSYVPVGGGLPKGWDYNQNNNVLEIVDESLVPVFRLIRRGRGELIVCGHFYADPIDKSSIVMGCGRREFAYSSWFHFGKPAQEKS